MINQQLVDYIKQQLQLGVSQEGIKNTLVTSGWPEADVSTAIASLEAKPAAPAVVSAAAVSPVTSDIFPKSSEPVSVKADPAKKAEPAAFQTKIESYTAPATSSPVASSGKRGMIMPIVLGLLALIFLAAGAYLYMEKSALDEDVATANQANNNLSREHAALVQEKSNMTGQLATLTDENDSLRAHLSFLLGSGTTTVKTTLKGTLKGDDKTPYTLVTASGLVVNLRNYKDARVFPLIKDLLNNGVQFTLEHLPGSRDAMIIAVNGAQVPAEAPAAPASTSTAPLSPDKPIVP